ncbi:MAG: radical SAM family heme chaperone HemW, partial [Balneolaceae bacterium]|nr:radical SAM family heme chaperone HemW [Balneolaceae bacterium]
QLIREIESYRDTRFVEEPVHTIYMGGGTPSLLKPEQLAVLTQTIFDVFEADIEEFTVEMNPDDVSESYLKELRSIGVNRASMGVQSFQPELLEFMHRAHDRGEALRSLELLSRAGFKNFTVDLIYGNPGETPGQLEEDLELLMEFEPPHLSAYSLTIEPKTRLGKQVQLGRIDPPEDERVIEQFELILEKLRSHGIHQYEVSNFSKPGAEAVHNRNYWEHHNYLGFGPSAHSFWWETDKAVRWSNKRDMKAYLQDGTGAEGERERLDHLQLAEERIMMGLRTRRGVTEKLLKEDYNYLFSGDQKTYLEKKREEGLLEQDDAIRLTTEGLKIADAIVVDLLVRH